MSTEKPARPPRPAPKTGPKNATPSSPPAVPPAQTKTPARGKPLVAPTAPKPPKKAPLPPDPVARAKRNRRDRQKRQAKLGLLTPPVLEVLAARWPAVFPADSAMIRPWAVGLFADICLRWPEQRRALIRAALDVYSNTEGYQAGLATGGPRYDLDGNPSGKVTPEEQAKAAKRLSQMQGKKSPEKAAGQP